MIAGYPGETRQEFEELLEFAATVRFDRLGCFPYCHEEFSPAFSLVDSVPEDEKESRTAELMELQEGISEEKTNCSKKRNLSSASIGLRRVPHGAERSGTRPRLTMSVHLSLPDTGLPPAHSASPRLRGVPPTNSSAPS